MYTAILLAAGRSSRMGQPKGLLDWNGKPLISHQLEQLRLSKLNQLVVVSGYQAEVYHPFLNEEPVLVIWNPNWEEGKCSSIKKGLEVISPCCRAILFVNIDQPVSASVVDQLLAASEQRKGLIHVPVFGGRRGHPVLFSTELLEELRSVTEEEQGLKKVLRAHQEQTVCVPVEDMGILYNFNTPADYKGGREI